MPLPPRVGAETEIQVAQRAGNRDRPDVDMLMRRIRLQCIHRPAHRGFEAGDLRVASGFRRACPVPHGTARPHRGYRRPATGTSAPATASHRARETAEGRRRGCRDIRRSTGCRTMTSRHRSPGRALSRADCRQRDRGRGMRIGGMLFDAAFQASDDRARHDFADIRAGRRVIQLHVEYPPQNLSFFARTAAKLATSGASRNGLAFISSARTDGTLG